VRRWPGRQRRSGWWRRQHAWRLRRLPSRQRRRQGKACKAAAAKKQKAMEVVGSNSDVEPTPLQKKGKGKAWAVSEESVGKAEVAETGMPEVSLVLYLFWVLLLSGC
jgi:hypothetical protein